MAWMRAVGERKLALDFRIVPLLQGRAYIRVADGFFPKYLAWYLPRRPFALTSGAAPRGSFS